jgi:ATP-binding cassette subfamily B protein/subfamily B ATP-binding cassette protein MsbA
MSADAAVAVRSAPSVDTSAVRLFGWLSGYASRRWRGLVAVLATMVAKIGLDLLKPWPMKLLVDHALGSQPLPPALATLVAGWPGGGSPEALIGWSVAATVMLFVAGWALGVAVSYANIGFGQRMVYDLATDVFSHLQRLSLKFHSRQSVGDSIRRVTTDCGCVSVIVKDAVLPFVAALVTFAAMFVVMWRLEPRLTLVSMVAAPWLVLVLRRYMQPMLDRSYTQQEAEARIYEVVERQLTTIPVVQAFGQEPVGDRVFAQTTDAAVRAAVDSAVVGLKFRALTGLGTALGTAVILWLGTHSVLEERLTVGGILVFLAYLAALYGPLEALMYAPSTTQGAVGSARRVLEILDTRREVADRPDAITVPRLRGHVRFEHVTCGYDEGRPILRDISLEVRPGETVALIGPTGAGKSTLAGLVPRFHDPWSGRVSVDGVDLRDLELKNLRSQVAVVLQEPFLLPTSIADNIAYGRPTATHAEIEAAARAANAHDFIVRLPQGYETVVAERGATLSGGERQRLSVARALLKDAPILILDEPTSAMDAVTEALLLDALQRLMKGRTTLMIAHRMSTVAHAHRIVALENGAIVEAGTPAELRRRGGVYARYHALQVAPGATVVREQSDRAEKESRHGR